MEGSDVTLQIHGHELRLELGNEQYRREYVTPTSGGGRKFACQYSSNNSYSRWESTEVITATGRSGIIQFV